MKQYGKTAMQRTLGKREINEAEIILLDAYHSIRGAENVPHWHRKIEIWRNLHDEVDLLLDGTEGTERGPLADIARDIAAFISRDKEYDKLKKKSQAKSQRRYQKRQAKRAQEGGSAAE